MAYHPPCFPPPGACPSPVLTSLLYGGFQLPGVLPTFGLTQFTPHFRYLPALRLVPTATPPPWFCGPHGMLSACPPHTVSFSPFAFSCVGYPPCKGTLTQLPELLLCSFSERFSPSPLYHKYGPLLLVSPSVHMISG